MKFKVFILSLVVLSQAVSFGATFKAGQYYKLSAKDTLDRDLFYGGREVRIAGAVQSDAVLGAETVRLSGNVGDDMFAWAKEIDVNGRVGDTFIGFAKEITISGVVRGDVVAYAGEVYLAPGARIEGNLYVGTGRLTIDEAFVGGNIRGGAHEIRLNGTCAGDIKLSGTQISFGERFKSDKKINITLHEEPQEPIDNAPAQMELTIEKEKYFFQKGWFYYFLFSAFVVGALLIGLFPGFFDSLVTLGRDKIGINLLTGTAVMIITPIVSAVLLIVFPLGALLWTGWFVLLYLSKIFAAFIFGHFLMQLLASGRRHNRYVSFFIGMLLIALLIKIPSVGFLFYLLAVISGAGTFVYYLFLARKNGATTSA